MPKVGFTGTQSVGKSSLVNALKNEPEFKDYKFQTERSKYLRDLGIPLNTDSTYKGQIIFCAERSSELLNENIITDRSIIDVMAFTQTSKSMRNKYKNAILTLGSLLIPEYDYIFYVSPEGVNIEDNNVRCTDAKFRDKIDNTIKNIIKINKDLIKSLHIISGTTEERVQQIKRVLFS